MSLPRDLLRPQLRLFMSVDVQDSTAFKQQADEQDLAPWRDYFLAFFRDFPSELERSLPPDAPVPQAWKLLGDEIVFSLEVTRLDDAARALTAFRNAVANYRPKVEKPRNLRLKGSAWVAGFPVGNAVVPVERGRGRVDEDYIGPSMDTGFRLSKMASRRKLAVSVELAWLLLHVSARKLQLPLHYEGRCQLKGVMERDGYPFIWTDLYHRKRPPLIAAEDALKPSAPARPRALRIFCERYIRLHGEPRFVPFVPGKFDRRTLAERKGFRCELKIVEATARRLWPELQIASATEKIPRRMRARAVRELAELEKLISLRV